MMPLGRAPSTKRGETHHLYSGVLVSLGGKCFGLWMWNLEHTEELIANGAREYRTLTRLGNKMQSGRQPFPTMLDNANPAYFSQNLVHFSQIFQTCFIDRTETPIRKFTAYRS